MLFELNEFEEYDQVHVALLSTFTALICINIIYTVSKWKNMFYAVRSTRFFQDSPSKRAGHIETHQEPPVTIQICCYNEGNVVKATIDSACSVDWPGSKLSVHICDDSTDPVSRKIVDDHVLHWKEQGINISIKRRPNRTGYKAGSLRWHFGSITTEFVAHMDADHRMTPDFLRRAMPHFYDSQGKQKTNIGLVQAPWGYYNMNQNLLTQADALSLDMHHVIEQTARSVAHGGFGFNGTGGIWRKDAIAAGGGWNWETVTEDLALSYQSVINGYRFVFVRDLPQELELPENLMAHIQQKHRWTKGFLQVFRNDFSKFLTASEISWFDKFEIFCHITGPVVYLLFVIGFVIFPYLMVHGIDNVYVRLGSVTPALDFFASALISIYSKTPSCTQRGRQRGMWNRTRRLPIILVFLALQGGMSCFQVKAFLEGLFSRDATFLATPKKGSNNIVKKQSWDDITALVGILLGVQRLFFLLTNDILHELSGSHLCFAVINLILCSGLFWVNAGFLVEKHKMIWKTHS